MSPPDTNIMSAAPATPVAALMNDPASPLAYMLHAWRRWLPDAIAAGTAMPHFMNYRERILNMKWKPVASSACRHLSLPPSLPALAADWPPGDKVRICVMALPWVPADIVREARAVPVVSRGNPDAPNAKARKDAARFYEAYGLIVPERPPECPVVAAMAKGGRHVYVAGLPELVAELPRARTLAAVLAKASRAAGGAP